MTSITKSCPRKILRCAHLSFKLVLWTHIVEQDHLHADTWSVSKHMHVTCQNVAMTIANLKTHNLDMLINKNTSHLDLHMLITGLSQRHRSLLSHTLMSEHMLHCIMPNTLKPLCGGPFRSSCSCTTYAQALLQIPSDQNNLSLVDIKFP